MITTNVQTIISISTLGSYFLSLLPITLTWLGFSFGYSFLDAFDSTNNALSMSLLGIYFLIFRLIIAGINYGILYSNYGQAAEGTADHTFFTNGWQDICRSIAVWIGMTFLSNVLIWLPTLSIFPSAATSGTGAVTHFTTLGGMFSTLIGVAMTYIGIVYPLFNVWIYTQNDGN